MCLSEEENRIDASDVDEGLRNHLFWNEAQLVVISVLLGVVLVVQFALDRVDT